jgi:hypothetical protein
MEGYVPNKTDFNDLWERAENALQTLLVFVSDLASTDAVEYMIFFLPDESEDQLVECAKQFGGI